jgi:DNA-binding response OmpR family regulator
MRLLLVEDNERLAELTGRELERLGYSVDRVASCEEAHEAAAVVEYDLMLVDRGLPDGDGLSFVQHLRQLGRTNPILVLSAQDEPAQRVEGLDTGADDYLVKPFDIQELAARCRALLRRPGLVHGKQLSAGNVSMNQTTREVTIAGTIQPMRRRELALLESMLRRIGNVVPRGILEQSLYGMDEAFTGNALDVTVSRLRRRLAEAGANLQIRSVHGIGYIASCPADEVG